MSRIAIGATRSLLAGRLKGTYPMQYYPYCLLNIEKQYPENAKIKQGIKE
jgi:hypothetical protein